MDASHPDFLKPRRYMREPIKDIFDAAKLLSEAADAHINGAFAEAERYIIQADNPNVRAWTESLWGSTKNNPSNHLYHRYREVKNARELLSKEKREQRRMPNKSERLELLNYYGRNCVFCGIPLIGQEVRTFFRKAYPHVKIWGPKNQDQHAAFQCMWLQYDHLVPHCRGGNNSRDNIVLTCAPCNYGRMEFTIEELGLIDPRTCKLEKTSWDGLERVLGSKNRTYL